MAAKQDTPAQHNLLHQYWPNNCCLCGHEARIAELEEKIRQLEAASWLGRLSQQELDEARYFADIESWQKRAVLAEAEIIELKQKLEEATVGVIFKTIEENDE